MFRKEETKYILLTPGPAINPWTKTSPRSISSGGSTPASTEKFDRCPEYLPPPSSPIQAMAITKGAKNNNKMRRTPGLNNCSVVDPAANPNLPPPDVVVTYGGRKWSTEEEEEKWFESVD